VTGAARGLGRTVAEILTDAGWTVWATDIADIPADLGVAHKVRLNVGDETAVQRLFKEIDAVGGVDGVVNNAAIFPLEPWDTVDIETFRHTVEVNLVGAFICCRAAGLAMRDHGRGGSIVNVSSLTFYKGIASGVAYSSSKGGVVGLTRSMARALGQHSVRVNCVAPGLMATEGVLEQVERGAFPRARVGPDDPERQLPGRTQPHGVAATIRYLLEDDSNEITGQTLAVDGGSIFL
jgi:pyridoxal 4-dehydrogenase